MRNKIKLSAFLLCLMCIAYSAAAKPVSDCTDGQTLCATLSDGHGHTIKEYKE